MATNPLQTGETVILASASQSRAAVLRNAGVVIECQPADIDEDAVKAGFRRDGRSAADVASSLAEMKAQRIGGDHAGREECCEHTGRAPGWLYCATAGPGQARLRAFSCTSRRLPRSRRGSAPMPIQGGEDV